MTITRQQLETISNSAQNDAIALAEVYREVFAKRFNVEVENALTQELSSVLNNNTAIASAVINSVASSYADSITVDKQTLETVRILKPRREAKPSANVQALLPPEKPKLKAIM